MDKSRKFTSDGVELYWWIAFPNTLENILKEIQDFKGYDNTFYSLTIEYDEKEKTYSAVGWYY